MRACKLVACTKGEKAVEKWQYQLDFPPPRYGSGSPPVRKPFPTVAGPAWRHSRRTDGSRALVERSTRAPTFEADFSTSCSTIGGAGQSIWPPIFLARDHAGGDEGRVQRHRNGDRQFQRVLDAV